MLYIKLVAEIFTKVLNDASQSEGWHLLLFRKCNKFVTFLFVIL